MIISPCISICKMDPLTGYCYGCGRNANEKNYGKMRILIMNGKKPI